MKILGDIFTDDIFSSSQVSHKISFDENGVCVGGIAQRSLIATCYHPILAKIYNQESAHFIFKGGRGSGKSSFCAIQVVAHLLSHPKDDAIVLLKTTVGIKDSIANNIGFAIDLFGLGADFKHNKTTHHYTYMPTGQQILLKGCDDPRKLKSMKPHKSERFGVIWFEELELFSDSAEIRSVLATFLRGGDAHGRHLVLYSYNPPKYRHHWLNSEFTLRDDQVITHTTYLDVPKEWLSDDFYREVEYTKLFNERAYRLEYLGEVVSQGIEVFDNVIEQKIDDAFIQGLPHVDKGLDFGFADPTAFVGCYYDRELRKLYIFAELYQKRMNTDALAHWIIEQKFVDNHYLYCDSARADLIDQLRLRGVYNAAPCHKWRGSVETGLSWLALQVSQIIVDSRRAPHTYRELISYRFVIDKNDVQSNLPPDKNNHAIDALRYAMQDYILS